MDRRDFLKNMTLGGLALKLGSGARRPNPRTRRRSAGPGLRPGRFARRSHQGSVTVLGGMSRFVAKGDVVMIKPNIGWDRTPELAACTNPDVVKALVELAFTRGREKGRRHGQHDQPGPALLCPVRNPGRGQRGRRRRPLRQPAPHQEDGGQGRMAQGMGRHPGFRRGGQDHQRPDRQASQPVPGDARHEELARRDRRSAQPAPSEARRGRGRPGRVFQARADRARRLPDPRPERPAGRPTLGHEAPEDGRRRNRLCRRRRHGRDVLRHPSGGAAVPQPRQQERVSAKSDLEKLRIEKRTV